MYYVQIVFERTGIWKQPGGGNLNNLQGRKGSEHGKDLGTLGDKPHQESCYSHNLLDPR